MKNKRHNTKFIQTLSLLKMTVITRSQIDNSNNSKNSKNSNISKKSNISKNSKNSNSPFVNLMKNVIPIRECAKDKTYLYKTRKFITDIDTGIANILCKDSNNKRNLNKRLSLLESMKIIIIIIIVFLMILNFKCVILFKKIQQKSKL